VEERQESSHQQGEPFSVREGTKAAMEDSETRGAGRTGTSADVKSHRPHLKSVKGCHG